MKKWIALLLVLVLAVPVFSQDRRVVDDADLLTDQEEVILQQMADTLSETYQIDVVLLTTPSLGYKDPEAFADDYYDSHDYGYGSEYSGILLVLSMEYRDWAISTTGEGRIALTDYGIQDVFSTIAPYLAKDQYYPAFVQYFQAMETYLLAYSQGKPIDGEKDPYEGPGTYIPGSGDDYVYYDDPLSFADVAKMVFFSLLIGAAAGGIGLLIMRSGMNTARKQTGAANYAPRGLQLSQRFDQYLYSNTHRVRRSQNSSSGGSSGGSRVHTGSSGRSHGGGHGKF